MSHATTTRRPWPRKADQRPDGQRRPRAVLHPADARSHSCNLGIDSQIAGILAPAGARPPRLRTGSAPPAPSAARPAVTADAGQQVRRRHALDNPVAGPSEAVRVGDPGQRGGQPLGGAGRTCGQPDGKAARALARCPRRAPARCPGRAPARATRGSIPACSLPASSAFPATAPAGPTRPPAGNRFLVPRRRATGRPARRHHDRDLSGLRVYRGSTPTAPAKNHHRAALGESEQHGSKLAESRSTARGAPPGITLSVCQRLDAPFVTASTSPLKLGLRRAIVLASSPAAISSETRAV